MQCFFVQFYVKSDCIFCCYTVMPTDNTAYSDSKKEKYTSSDFVHVRVIHSFAWYRDWDTSGGDLLF